MTAELITTAEELAELPLGQWILDAKDEPWVLIDTNVMWRQRMWRDRDGIRLTNHDGVRLPAGLADFDGDCEHAKLNIEGWQCQRCGKVINEPPPVPEQVKPEKGRAWFYSDAFGEWCGMSPDFDNIIALAEDVVTRPHDTAAHDRFSFEIAELARALGSDVLDDEDMAHGLGLIIQHLVARKVAEGVS